MFGNKKMYKKGAEDALRANEGFSQKQQEALEELRRQVQAGQVTIEEGLANLGEDIHGLYDYLDAKEKAALYHLSTPLDIRKMDDNERQLLVAVLCQLANDEGSNLTELQQTYLRGVQRYVGITTPQAALDDMSVVGEIDSGAAQRAIMQTVLEFLYLQNAYELTDSQVEFLGYFSVNQKQSMAIENSVSLLYNAMGAQGLAEKYGTQNASQSDEEMKETLNSLQIELKNLEKHTAVMTVLVSVNDHSKLSIMAADDREAFKSQSDCERAAERRLEKVVKDAQTCMDKYLVRQKPDSYYARCKKSIENRLDRVRECLESMRTEQTAAVIDQMERPMNNLSTLWNNLGEINDRLAPNYQLDGVGKYSYYIEYDEYNPGEFLDGLAKMLAKKQFGFSCYEAVSSITDDGQEKLTEFMEEFDEEIQGEIMSLIVEPIRDLIPELRKAWGGDAADPEQTF